MSVVISVGRGIAVKVVAGAVFGSVTVGFRGASVECIVGDAITSTGSVSTGVGESGSRLVTSSVVVVTDGGGAAHPVRKMIKMVKMNKTDRDINYFTALLLDSGLHPG